MDRIAALAKSCRIAKVLDPVLNSECAFTFHSPYTSEKGIVVSLTTFVGTVEELGLNGSDEGEEGLFVRIAKRRVEKYNGEERADGGGDEAPQTVIKLGVGVEGGFRSEQDHFETISTISVVVLRAIPGGCEVVAELPYDASDPESRDVFPTHVALAVDAVVNHAGMSVQQDLKAWELDEDPKPVSKYAATLPFVNNGVQISPDPASWKCHKSGATDNLWLNLSTGVIGDGRRNWDGSGGSNGALDHYVETGEQYPLVVKLGTITTDEEAADCYSYAKDEDGPVLVPNLAALLERRGIRVAGMQKTVKSTAELEVELNATYAFDAITESGASLVPVSGPGLQGLQNLGNSCYVNSVVQMMFGGNIAELVSRYGVKAGGSVTTHPLLSAIRPRDAPQDFLCQVAKLGCALTSGTFAAPVAEENPSGSGPVSTDPRYRLAPRMFKNVVGGNHVDFRTGQQQDAAQYLQHLFEKLDRAELGAGSGRLGRGDRSTGSGDKGEDGTGSPSPSISLSSSLFAFKTESRLVCASDGRVKYRESAPETILNLRIPMEKAITLPASSSLAAATGESFPALPEFKRHKSGSVGDGEGEGEGNNILKSKGEEVPTIALQDCLESWSAAQTIDDLRWPHLGNATSPATAQTRMVNFPRYLIAQMQRYELGEDWVPRKIEVNVDVPHKLDIEYLKASGPQGGESLVPEADENKVDDSAELAEAPSASVPSQVPIDPDAISQLMDMGFSLNGCKRALFHSSNVEQALSWIFEHSMDPDFNDPLPEPEAEAVPATRDGAVDEVLAASLVDNLGCFTAEQVKAALKESNGAADRAADWLFSHMDDLDGAIAALASGAASVEGGPSTGKSASLEDGIGKYNLIAMISHIGKQPNSGHYVAHVKKGEDWVIFNDEKVCLSQTPPFKHAYMYLYQRDDTVGSPNASF